MKNFFCYGLLIFAGLSITPVKAMEKIENIENIIKDTDFEGKQGGGEVTIDMSSIKNSDNLLANLENSLKKPDDLEKETSNNAKRQRSNSNIEALLRHSLDKRKSDGTGSKRNSNMDKMLHGINANVQMTESIKKRPISDTPVTVRTVQKTIELFKKYKPQEIINLIKSCDNNEKHKSNISDVNTGLTITDLLKENDGIDFDLLRALALSPEFLMLLQNNDLQKEQHSELMEKIEIILQATTTRKGHVFRCFSYETFANLRSLCGLLLALAVIALQIAQVVK